MEPILKYFATIPHCNFQIESGLPIMLQAQVGQPSGEGHYSTQSKYR